MHVHFWAEETHCAKTLRCRGILWIEGSKRGPAWLMCGSDLERVRGGAAELSRARTRPCFWNLITSTEHSGGSSKAEPQAVFCF